MHCPSTQLPGFSRQGLSLMQGTPLQTGASTGGEGVAGEGEAFGGLGEGAGGGELGGSGEGLVGAGEGLGLGEGLSLGDGLGSRGEGEGVGEGAAGEGAGEGAVGEGAGEAGDGEAGGAALVRAPADQSTSSPTITIAALKSSLAPPRDATHVAGLTRPRMPSDPKSPKGTRKQPLGVSAGQWVHSSQSMVSLHRCAHSSGVAVVFRVPPTTAAPRKSVWLRTVEALDPALISSSSSAVVLAAGSPKGSLPLSSSDRSLPPVHLTDDPSATTYAAEASAVPDRMQVDGASVSGPLSSPKGTDAHPAPASGGQKLQNQHVSPAFWHSLAQASASSGVFDTILISWEPT